MTSDLPDDSNGSAEPPTTLDDGKETNARAPKVDESTLNEALHLAGAKKESACSPGRVPSAFAGRTSEGKDTIMSQAIPKRSNAFAQLVQGWEEYLNDSHAEDFPTLQMLQNLQLCGPANLSGPLLPAPPEGHPLAPPALRHTHSSPLKYGKSIFDREDDNVPPPIPLDPFQRSSSTPSSFRYRSITSAFSTLPSQRETYTSIRSPGSRLSAFDPVKYYASALEDMERTSIEVTDVRPGPSTDAPEHDGSGLRGAASRAARFLSDVRVLRRKRRTNGDRDTAVKSDTTGESSPHDSCGLYDGQDTAVTVITEAEPVLNVTSIMPPGSEALASLEEETGRENDEEEKLEEFYNATLPGSDDEEKDDDARRDLQHYQQLDSDADDDELHFQKIEASLQSESPGTIPSPSYQEMIDERPGSAGSSGKQAGTRIRIQIPEQRKIVAPAVTPPCSTDSPSPTRMVGSSTPRSQDSITTSPGTRSAGTGSSLGHTTHATLSTLQSGLSTISETDREVMEANTEGKRRRDLDSLRTLRKDEPEGGSVNSLSSNSSNPHGYLALDNSPDPLREGANVPADRFFTNSPAPMGGNGPSTSYSRPQFTMVTRTSNVSSSPGTVETSSATRTSGSSAGSSSEEKPPKFVSYFDRQGASDLTSHREAAERSSPRADPNCSEEREDSPAQLVAYPSVVFEQANSSAESAPSDTSTSASGRNRPRSRPPRSPTKGMRPLTTPPPRGSVSPLLQQHSPPRNIVDHPSSSISRPFVTRTTLDGPELVKLGSARRPSSLHETVPDNDSIPAVAGVSSPINDSGHLMSYQEDELPSLLGSSVLGRTYEDGSVEIVKTLSKDESTHSSTSNVVTPEKNASSD